MTTYLEVRAWPSSLDAVQWSQLNEIAVALGDHVDLFIPKHSLKQDQAKARDKASQWQQLKIQTSIFTHVELPLIDSLPSSHFSLGEEQTYSDIASLAWSPPGISRHKRCALAILTSNHVLSLWSSRSNPAQPESWERVLIVNHAVVEPNSQDAFVHGEDSTGTDQDARLPWRIRSFAWGPVISSPHRFHTNDGRDIEIMVDRFFVAVTNDAGELVVLEIESPQQVLVDRARKWVSHVVFRVLISSQPHRNPKAGDINADIFRQGSFATDVAWRKWKSYPDADETIDASIFAYRIGKRVFVRSLLTMVGDSLSMMLAPSTVDVAGEHDGPLRLIAEVSLEGGTNRFKANANS